MRWPFGWRRKKTELSELTAKIDALVIHQHELDKNLDNVWKQIALTLMVLTEMNEKVNKHGKLINAQVAADKKMFQWIYLICSRLREKGIEIPNSPVPDPKTMN